jgi:plastocyanin
MQSRTTFVAMAAVALSLAAGGCGGSADAGGVTNPSGGNTGGSGLNANAVSIVALTFSPGTLNVPAGTTVSWQWGGCNTGGYGGGACVSHSVTFDDGSNISSPTQDSGTFSRTFATPGTYKYHCAVHGYAMSGEIDVK